jgi:hypothetical protein
MVANGLCGGAPRTETIAFSFDWSWEFRPDFGYYQAYLKDFTDIASGPLGSFTQNFGRGRLVSQFFIPIPVP